MNRCWRLLSVTALFLALGGCTQRTVLSSDSRVTFGGTQMGNYEELREKFGAECEMKDGVPVATNGRSNLQLKTLELNSFKTKSFEGSSNSLATGKKFATSMFNRTPEVKTAAASEGRKVFPTRAAAGTGMEFVTQDAAEAGQSFAQSSKQDRDGDHEFYAAKRSARESQSRITQARADVVLDRSTGRLREAPVALTEQQVRDILHPGISSKD